MFSDGRSGVHKESNLFIPSYRDWLRSSVLSQSADSFVGYLQDHYYCPATVRALLLLFKPPLKFLFVRVPLMGCDHALMLQPPDHDAGTDPYGFGELVD